MGFEIEPGFAAFRGVEDADEEEEEEEAEEEPRVNL